MHKNTSMQLCKYWLRLEFLGARLAMKLICNWYCIFHLLVFNVIWGCFSALVSKWPLTRKQLAVECNEMKFGTWGYSCNMNMGYLWPNLGFWASCHMLNLEILVCNVILGSFSALVSKLPVTRKQLAVESKRNENVGFGGSCNMNMGYLWSFSVQGNFGVL